MAEESWLGSWCLDIFITSWSHQLVMVVGPDARALVTTRVYFHIFHLAFCCFCHVPPALLFPDTVVVFPSCLYRCSFIFYSIHPAPPHSAYERNDTSSITRTIHEVHTAI